MAEKKRPEDRKTGGKKAGEQARVERRDYDLPKMQQLEVQVSQKRIIEVEEATDRLPKKVVDVLANEGLQIKLEKLADRLLADQSRALSGSNGCISNPGGPGC